MAIYKIEWKKSAQKEIKKIAKPDILKILEKVESLAIEPFPPNYKKYLGTEHTYRIRMGNYRVIYSISDEILMITIIRVGHRKEVYKK